MTAADECIHGLTGRSCTICIHGPTPTGDPTPVPVGQPFTASYPGDCPDCDRPISAGDRIGHWSDHRYRHVGCKP